jgi:DNA polymerase II large subunit
MRRHVHTATGAALALALVLSGCSAGDTEVPEPEANPTRSPSSTPTDTETPVTAEAEATDRLTKYLEVRDDALRKMSFVGHRFDRLASGQEFLALQQRIIEYSSNGFSMTGNYTHSVGDTRQRNDSTVLVDVCEDESDVRLRTRDGKPVKRSLDGSPIPTSRSVEYTLTLIKNQWLVTASNYVLRPSGQVRSC